MTTGHSRPMRSSGLLRMRPLVLGIAMWMAGNGAGVLALPTGEQVVGGQAMVSRPTASTLVVNQATDRAAIEWQQFNLGAGERAQILQPSSQSFLLNRIVGGSPSEIYGTLQANGRVMLVNPSGVHFMPGAQVDVGGLVASNLQIGTQDFLAGRLQFTRPDGTPGTVSNAGVITASPGGFVALIGQQVENRGAITVPGGSIGLAAGDRVLIDFERDGLMLMTVDVSAAAAKITQSGVLNAEGGRVALEARAKDALQSTVINSDGIIRARGVVERNGQILLDGGSSGVVAVSGELDASGRGTGQRGGEVRVLGDDVRLTGTARVDASGDRAGGAISIGGISQLQGAPASAAGRTQTGADTRLLADALVSGDGGSIFLWGSRTLTVGGNVSVRGGLQGGNGGFVETSGQGLIHLPGRIDASAPNGNVGTWRIDPDDIRATVAACVVAGGSCISEQEINVANANTEIVSTTSLTWHINRRNVDISAPTTQLVLRAQAGNIVFDNSGTAANPGQLFVSGSKSVEMVASGNIDLQTASVVWGAGGDRSGSRIALTAGGNVLSSGVLNASAIVIVAGGRIGNSAVNANNAPIDPVTQGVVSLTAQAGGAVSIDHQGGLVTLVDSTSGATTFTNTAGANAFAVKSNAGFSLAGDVAGSQVTLDASSGSIVRTAGAITAPVIVLRAPAGTIGTPPTTNVGPPATTVPPVPVLTATPAGGAATGTSLTASATEVHLSHSGGPVTLTGASAAIPAGGTFSLEVTSSGSAIRSSRVSQATGTIQAGAIVLKTNGAAIGTDAAPVVLVGSADVDFTANGTGVFIERRDGSIVLRNAAFDPGIINSAGSGTYLVDSLGAGKTIRGTGAVTGGTIVLRTDAGAITGSNGPLAILPGGTGPTSISASGASVNLSHSGGDVTLQTFTGQSVGTVANAATAGGYTLRVGSANGNLVIDAPVTATSGTGDPNVGRIILAAPGSITRSATSATPTLTGADFDLSAGAEIGALDRRIVLDSVGSAGLIATGASVVIDHVGTAGTLTVSGRGTDPIQTGADGTTGLYFLNSRAEVKTAAPVKAARVHLEAGGALTLVNRGHVSAGTIELIGTSLTFGGAGAGEAADLFTGIPVGDRQALYLQSATFVRPTIAADGAPAADSAPATFAVRVTDTTNKGDIGISGTPVSLDDLFTTRLTVDAHSAFLTTGRTVTLQDYAVIGRPDPVRNTALETYRITSSQAAANLAMAGSASAPTVALTAFNGVTATGDARVIGDDIRLQTATAIGSVTTAGGVSTVNPFVTQSFSAQPTALSLRTTSAGSVAVRHEARPGDSASGSVLLANDNAAAGAGSTFYLDIVAGSVAKGQITADNAVLRAAGTIGGATTADRVALVDAVAGAAPMVVVARGTAVNLSVSGTNVLLDQFNLASGGGATSLTSAATNGSFTLSGAGASAVSVARALAATKISIVDAVSIGGAGPLTSGEITLAATGNVSAVTNGVATRLAANSVNGAVTVAHAGGSIVIGDDGAVTNGAGTEYRVSVTGGGIRRAAVTGTDTRTLHRVTADTITLSATDAIGASATDVLLTSSLLPSTGGQGNAANLTAAGSSVFIEHRGAVRLVGAHDANIARATDGTFYLGTTRFSSSGTDEANLFVDADVTGRNLWLASADQLRLGQPGTGFFAAASEPVSTIDPAAFASLFLRTGTGSFTALPTNLNGRIAERLVLSAPAGTIGGGAGTPLDLAPVLAAGSILTLEATDVDAASTRTGAGSGGNLILADFFSTGAVPTAIGSAAANRATSGAYRFSLGSGTLRSATATTVAGDRITAGTIDLEVLGGQIGTGASDTVKTASVRGAGNTLGTTALTLRGTNVHVTHADGSVVLSSSGNLANGPSGRYFLDVTGTQTGPTAFADLTGGPITASQVILQARGSIGTAATPLSLDGGAAGMTLTASAREVRISRSTGDVDVVAQGGVENRATNGGYFLQTDGGSIGGGGAVSAPGGTVELRASGAISMADVTALSARLIAGQGIGGPAAGGIHVQAGTIVMRGGAAVTASTEGASTRLSASGTRVTLAHDGGSVTIADDAIDGVTNTATTGTYQLVLAGTGHVASASQGNDAADAITAGTIVLQAAGGTIGALSGGGSSVLKTAAASPAGSSDLTAAAGNVFLRHVQGNVNTVDAAARINGAGTGGTYRLEAVPGSIGGAGAITASGGTVELRAGGDVGGGSVSAAAVRIIAGGLIDRGAGTGDSLQAGTIVLSAAGTVTASTAGAGTRLSASGTSVTLSHAGGGVVVADDAGSDAVRNRATAGAFELRLLDAGNVTSASAPAANPAAERDEIAAGRVVITAAAQSRIGASADAPLKLANGTALRTDVTARAGSVFLQQRGDARLVSGPVANAAVDAGGTYSMRTRASIAAGLDGALDLGGSVGGSTLVFRSATALTGTGTFLGAGGGSGGIDTLTLEAGGAGGIPALPADIAASAKVKQLAISAPGGSIGLDGAPLDLGSLLAPEPTIALSARDSVFARIGAIGGTGDRILLGDLSGVSNIAGQIYRLDIAGANLERIETGGVITGQRVSLSVADGQLGTQARPVDVQGIAGQDTTVLTAQATSVHVRALSTRVSTENDRALSNIASAGDYVLTAPAGSIVGAGRVAATSGSVQLNAANDVTGGEIAAASITVTAGRDIGRGHLDAGAGNVELRAGGSITGGSVAGGVVRMIAGGDVQRAAGAGESIRAGTIVIRSGGDVVATTEGGSTRLSVSGRTVTLVHQGGSAVIVDDAGSDQVKNTATAGSYRLSLDGAIPGDITSASLPGAPGAATDAVSADTIVLQAAGGTIGANAAQPLKIASLTGRTALTAAARAVFVAQMIGSTDLTTAGVLANRAAADRTYALQVVNGAIGGTGTIEAGRIVLQASGAVSAATRGATTLSASGTGVTVDHTGGAVVLKDYDAAEGAVTTVTNRAEGGQYKLVAAGDITSASDVTGSADRISADRIDLVSAGGRIGASQGRALKTASVSTLTALTASTNADTGNVYIEHQSGKVEVAGTARQFVLNAVNGSIGSAGAIDAARVVLSAAESVSARTVRSGVTLSVSGQNVTVDHATGAAVLKDFDAAEGAVNVVSNRAPGGAYRLTAPGAITTAATDPGNTNPVANAIVAPAIVLSAGGDIGGASAPVLTASAAPDAGTALTASGDHVFLQHRVGSVRIADDGTLGNASANGSAPMYALEVMAGGIIGGGLAGATTDKSNRIASSILTLSATGDVGAADTPVRLGTPNVAGSSTTFTVSGHSVYIADAADRSVFRKLPSGATNQAVDTYSLLSFRDIPDSAAGISGTGADAWMVSARNVILKSETGTIGEGGHVFPSERTLSWPFTVPFRVPNSVIPTGSDPFSSGFVRVRADSVRVETLGTDRNAFVTGPTLTSGDAAIRGIASSVTGDLIVDSRQTIRPDAVVKAGTIVVRAPKIQGGGNCATPPCYFELSKPQQSTDHPLLSFLASSNADSGEGGNFGTESERVLISFDSPQGRAPVAFYVDPNLQTNSKIALGRVTTGSPLFLKSVSLAASAEPGQSRIITLDGSPLDVESINAGSIETAQAIADSSQRARENANPKENAESQLRKGVFAKAGRGQPAVDDSTGTQGPGRCEAVARADGWVNCQ
ncbi:MAG: filamentous hemagglutinin N-terminal domain-containing protein [Burkholderiales bacterium]